MSPTANDPFNNHRRILYLDCSKSASTIFTRTTYNMKQIISTVPCCYKMNIMEHKRITQKALYTKHCCMVNTNTILMKNKH